MCHSGDVALGDALDAQNRPPPGRSYLTPRQALRTVARRNPKRLVVALGALALAITVGSWALGVWGVTHPSTGPVQLGWQCWNGIFWTDPANGSHWWAQDYVAASGRLGESTTALRYSSVGRITFTGRNTARFHGQTGFQVPLIRVPNDRTFEQICMNGIPPGVTLATAN
jgi:hypothetical protein